MQLWIGTSGFQYPEWKGDFYPEKLAVARMLGYYSERFPTTEINYSFRRIPSEKTIGRWSAETPESFRFSLKAPQKVTHFAKLRDCAEVMAYFHQVMLGLGGKRGAVLFQLPAAFEKDAGVLAAFLKSLPEGMKAAFEFRHESWFCEEIYDCLRAANAALCLAESAELAVPRVATADFGYLRLRREDYSKADLADWADFVTARKGQWKEAFVYFKHEEKGVGPKFARTMMDLLDP